MWRTILLYAAVLAAGVFVLEFLEYQYLARRFGPEIMIGTVAVGFAALGIWVGTRLKREPPPPAFEKNTAALNSLGITDREYEVLAALAGGGSNKEIARDLDVSPNTIKTHIANLFEKLEASKRIEAIEKARRLHLIP